MKAEDKRNPKPSETELKRADFVFKCTFNVDRLAIDDKFPDKVDGIEVEKFFNKKVDKKTSNNLHLETNNTSKSLKIKIKKRASENVKDKDEVRDEVKAETAPSNVLRCKVKDEVRISENFSPKINLRTSENFKDEVKTKTAPSDILRYKDEVGISENVSPKINMRTSENFKDEVKTKTAPSDILHYKVIEKDEVRMSENVSPKIRTSENFKDEAKYEVKTKTAPSDILHCKVKDNARTCENISPKRLLDSHSFKRRKIIEENSIVGQNNITQKKEDFDEKEELRQDKSVKPNRRVIEVTERPNSPWKERLQKAQESDTLVLLSNLDPSYTSYEVEDLVWHTLKEKVEARMIESSPTSNTYYGRALIIFRTKDAAENAISELNRRCLILEGGRVVIARKGTVTDPAKQNTLTGHLSINRAARHKQSREMRDAVSTSHCSQPNTIEYAMAMEWTKHYYKSEACWEALREVEPISLPMNLPQSC
ncbi:hypothetical protein TSUD_113470 [Trifolium subterraneum]|uniref:RRM domain-containing protein n=1 Tax=Trifolium subterraneum TaxID=3900 RepID=A0A2Z6M148_TRISU|nr:hypothetical protein TSUD_113470 [Trifolium subterraneum]